MSSLLQILVVQQPEILTHCDTLVPHSYMTAFSHDNSIADHLQPLIHMYQSETSGLVDHCRPNTAAKLDDNTTLFVLK